MNDVEEIRCLEARSLLSGYLDNELSPLDDLRVEMHLENCGSCHQEQAELAAVAAFLAEAGFDTGEAPSWQALEQRLHNAAGSEPATVARELSQRSGGSGRPATPSSWPGRWLTVGALAASLLLGLALASWLELGGGPELQLEELSAGEWSELAEPLGIPEIDAYLAVHGVREVPVDQLARHVEFEPRAPRRLPGGYRIVRSLVVREQGRASTCLLYRRGNDSIALLERDAELPVALGGGSLEERTLGGMSCLVGTSGRTRVVELVSPGSQVEPRLCLVVREGNTDLAELVRYLSRGETF